MTSKNLSELSSDELLVEYEKIVVAQDDSFKNARLAIFKKQYWRREAICRELQSRPGEQRELLATLFKHPKAWVRICVASDTFVLNEARARMHMEYIAEHTRDPYRGEARSALGSWDRGFHPS
ncbi:MAG: hypothetical protein JWN07_1676 [Hyphomicrobiales bacterium]|nr:hypothetical protein [Hyphomicrobiales bacterium]